MCSECIARKFNVQKLHHTKLITAQSAQGSTKTQNWSWSCYTGKAAIFCCSAWPSCVLCFCRVAWPYGWDPTSQHLAQASGALEPPPPSLRSPGTAPNQMVLPATQWYVLYLCCFHLTLTSLGSYKNPTYLLLKFLLPKENYGINPDVNVLHVRPVTVIQHVSSVLRDQSHLKKVRMVPF